MAAGRVVGEGRRGTGWERTVELGGTGEETGREWRTEWLRVETEGDGNRSGRGRGGKAKGLTPSVLRVQKWGQIFTWLLTRLPNSEQIAGIDGNHYLQMARAQTPDVGNVTQNSLRNYYK